MTPEQIIAAMNEQCSCWVEVEPGKHVRVQRPLESQFPLYLRPGEGPEDPARWVCSFEQVKQVATGWKGFTEADLIESGASDAVPFSPQLWARVVSDKVAYATPVASKVTEMIAGHQFSLDETEKN